MKREEGRDAGRERGERRKGMRLKVGEEGKQVRGLSGVLCAVAGERARGRGREEVKASSLEATRARWDSFPRPPLFDQLSLTSPARDRIRKGMADPPHKKSKGFLSRASRARPEWSRRSLANGSSPGPAQSPTPVASGSTLSLDSQDYPQPTESLFPPSAYSSNIHSAANASAISHLGSLHHSTTSHAAASATGSAGVSEASLVSTLVRRVVSRVRETTRSERDERTLTLIPCSYRYIAALQLLHQSRRRALHRLASRWRRLRGPSSPMSSSRS